MAQHFLSISWDVKDEVRHKESFKKNHSYDSGPEEDGGEGAQIDAFKTTEIRAYCVNHDNRRVLLRIQNAPVMAYLQIPDTVPYTDTFMREGADVGWKSNHASLLVNWLNGKLREISNKRKKDYDYAITESELVKRNLLHYYAEQSFGRTFLLLSFNTLAAMRALQTFLHGYPERKKRKQQETDSENPPPETVRSFSVLSQWKPVTLILHETNITPLSRLKNITQINFAGWFSAKTEDVPGWMRITHERYHKDWNVRVDSFDSDGSQKSLFIGNRKAHLEYFVNWKTIHPSTREFPLPLNKLSFDIETYGSGLFPVASAGPDEIFMISAVTKTLYAEDSQRNLLFVCVHTSHIGSTKYVPAEGLGGTPQEYTILYYPTELDMILAFFQFISAYDPDILLGYNIEDFDAPYLHNRLEKYGVFDQDLRDVTDPVQKQRVLTRNVGRFRDFFAKSEVSSYHKHTEERSSVSTRWVIPGRFVFDVYLYISRTVASQEGFRSNKLDYVAMQILNERKLDVTAQEMFRIYREQKALLNFPEYMMPAEANARALEVQQRIYMNAIPDAFRKNLLEMDVVADYCIVDACLVLRLFEKRELMSMLIGFSNIMAVPMYYLFTRGQQIRVFSKIADFCHQKGYVIDKRTWEFVQVAGAIVQDPVPSIVDVVGTLDFTGLYPSIIRCWNFCYTTLIPNDQIHLYNREDYEEIEVFQMESVVKNPNATFMLLDEEDPNAEPRSSSTDAQRASAKYEEIQDLLSDMILEENVDDPSELPLNKEGDVELTDATTREEIDALLGARDASGLIKIGSTIVEKHRKTDTQLVEVKRLVRFVKPHIKKGLIVEILEQLTSERNKEKKEMKKYKEGTVEYALHDSRQLALKLLSNALYGFLGAQKNGFLPLPDAFMCVTARGRQLITTTKDNIIKLFKVRIIYGDTDSLMFKKEGLDAVEGYKMCVMIEAAINGKRDVMIEMLSSLSQEEMRKFGSMFTRDHPIVTGEQAWFPYPISMDFEKLMRIVVFKKKNYMYWKYTPKGDFEPNASGAPKEFPKGVKTARRDNCPYQQSIFGDTLTMLLQMVPAGMILKNTMEQVTMMMNDVYDLPYYALNKAMGSYAADSKSQMRILGETMAMLGFPLKAGERVNFIYREKSEKDEVDKMSYRMLELDWCMSLPPHERPRIDKEYYAKNAIAAMSNPIWMILNLWTTLVPGRERHRRRVLDGIEIKKHGTRLGVKTKQIRSLKLMKDPAKFISEAALSFSPQPSELPGAGIQRCMEWIIERFDTETPGSWYADAGIPWIDEDTRKTKATLSTPKKKQSVRL